MEEIDKETQENHEIANNENEQSAVREQASKKTPEKTEQQNALENESKQLKEGMPLHERVKEIFKKYGFTATVVLLAAGITISVITNSLSKGLKEMANDGSNGLQTLNEK